jgi:predicted GIY-YIG superfamily endonuclease
MAWVYILKGSSGRHYMGPTLDLVARIAQHERGHTCTTKRLATLQLVARREYSTLTQARRIERSLKRKKDPEVAIYHLQQ